MPIRKKDKKTEVNIVTLKRTGNFWIDNGIIGLYLTLDKLNTETQRERLLLQPFCFELSEDGTEFKIKAANEEELVRLMNAARECAVENFVTESTKNKRNIVFNETTRTFSHPLKKNFLPAYKDFYAGKIPIGTKAAGTEETNTKKGTMAILTREDLVKVEALRKEFPELKVEKNVWINEPPKYEVGSPFEISFLEKGEKLCAFSNESWRYTEDVKGYNFPFLTGSGGINFFSQFTGSFEISCLHAFASIFSPLNVFYSLWSGSSCYFIPYDENLERLSIWSSSLRPIHGLGENKSCNFKKPMITTKEGKEFGLPTTYLNESLLVFLYSMYHYAYREMKRDFRKEVMTKNIVSMISDGNIFREVRIFSKLEPLFELFETMFQYEHSEERNWTNAFVGMFNNFSNPQNRDTPWKERLSKAILDFTSVCGIIEEFLGDVAMRNERTNFFISHFVELYTKENQIMNPTTISLCKSLGNNIGWKCRETKDKGILYSLRNAKNRTNFLKVLSDAQFRLEIGYSEQFFIDLPDSPEWEEMKSLVTIFAMNSFLYNPKSKGEPNNA
jgi:hypothetical protein